MVNLVIALARADHAAPEGNRLDHIGIAVLNAGFAQALPQLFPHAVTVMAIRQHTKDSTELSEMVMPIEVALLYFTSRLESMLEELETGGGLKRKFRITARVAE